ncbi:hypothetical protein [Paenibacillus sp. FSL R5-0486]|uniref:hypothetical protein n=1 Tax=Paenibacillus sp. FSL R5-0486 TaxID=2921645 RepID=UPI0030D9BDFB
MTENFEFEGYHGTSESAAVKIEKGNFNIDYNRIGWLGNGVYFFQEDIEMANYWATRKFKNKGISVGLFRVELAMLKRQVFDVTDPLGEHNKYYQGIRKRFVENEIKKHGINVKAKNQDDLDGKVYNMICIKDRYKLVRGCTITPDDNDREHKLIPHTPNGVELCLRDVQLITLKEKISFDGSV